MSPAARALAGFAASIVGLALISVVLSTKANTSNVIAAGGSAFSGLLTSATAAVG